MQRLARVIAVFPIRIYRFALSPMFPGACRFHPTCSRYAEEAILTHGIGRGSWLATRRLLRCHPWSEARVDPVPTIVR